MSVQPGRLRTHFSQPETARPDSPTSPLSFVIHSSFWPRFGQKSKKAALGLVQSSPNPYIINRITQKFASEKQAKTSKNHPNSTFFGRFRAFSSTLSLRRIVA